jgi:hypothetical protein
VENTTEKINWVKLNTEWESSGLSQKQFCQEKGVGYSLFVQHRSKLTEKKKSPVQARFSTVNVMPASPSMKPTGGKVNCRSINSIVLSLPTGVRLDIPSGVDLAQLKHVLGLLGVITC